MTLQLQARIQSARDEAHSVCSSSGDASAACAVAWDTVEELQAEAAHQRSSQQSDVQNSLQQFCDRNPEAPECRIYED